jgi:ABC-type Fe3+-hydroxamate transport system substrate-binding protein
MVYTDQLNRKIELSSPPKRIISLVPSQTELLYDLGLRDEVVGITKFCIHPEEWFRSKTRVGGTKKYDFEKIKALQPDLIIGNKEENEEEQIRALMQDYKVWMSDIYNLKDALGMIASFGPLLGKNTEATNIKLEIEARFHRFNQLKDVTPSGAEGHPIKAAYFIWRNPYMAAGTHTFIDSMLSTCGFRNAFQSTRYPEVSAEQIKAANPELVLLSSEPYPFADKHVEEFRVLCPDAKILVVDGELFSWYGSRLLQAPDYFRQLLDKIASL